MTTAVADTVAMPDIIMLDTMMLLRWNCPSRR